VAAGHAERLAPIHAALIALVRGERQLLNFNPETRGPAETILSPPPRADSRRRDAGAQKACGRRGRPSKRRGR